MNSFKSEFNLISEIMFPTFTGTRIMMLPIVLGDVKTVPIVNYHKACETLFDAVASEVLGQVAYLTIDEREVREGESHRLSGLHVDGVYGSHSGAWGGGGGWASTRRSIDVEGVSTGMLLASNKVGCKAYRAEVQGYPRPEGECDHLVDQLPPGELLDENHVYWLSGMCIHESLPQPVQTKRQLLRLSMPSDAPWFEGYTVSPYGVQPTGQILPYRSQMNRV